MADRLADPELLLVIDGLAPRDSVAVTDAVAVVLTLRDDVGVSVLVPVDVTVEGGVLVGVGLVVAVPDALAPVLNVGDGEELKDMLTLRVLVAVPLDVPLLVGVIVIDAVGEAE